MTERQEHQASTTGPLSAVSTRPLLFIAVAACLFAGLLFWAHRLMASPQVEAHIQTEIITLDADAASPASLVRMAPSDPASLKELIGHVIASIREPSSVLFRAHDLVIEGGDGDGEIVLSLTSDDGGYTIEELNALASKIIDRLNQHRAEQRNWALDWIERAGAVWKIKIDTAREAAVDGSSNTDIVEKSRPLGNEKLLRLMMNAMVEAQEAGRSFDPNVASDVARMEDVLTELAKGRAERPDHGTALREAEAGLARHQEEAAAVTSEGSILDRPAAFLRETAPAQASGLASLGWPLIVPVLTVVSLLLALIATIVACRMNPLAEFRSDDYLNDPNWPLSPNSYNEISDPSPRRASAGYLRSG